jgi:inward rectifier potassium channel
MPAPRVRTSYKVTVIGAPHESALRDAYHYFLRLTWPRALGVLVAAYLALNTVFALAYLLVGGVTHMQAGSFLDAYAFSVQTLGTIGYGTMSPETRAAQALVTLESVSALLFTALSTGLLFAKFSQPVGRVAFATYATVAPMDGVPTLMVRVGNERGNAIVDAQVRLVAMRTVKTREGVTFYRMEDLAPRRDRTPAMNRSWTVMHTLDERSPLHGATPASLASDETELMVSLVGVDDTSYQPVHARAIYENQQILFGARHADVLSETADGNVVLDVGRFDEVVGTAATADFPYAWTPPAAGSPRGTSPNQP